MYNDWSAPVAQLDRAAGFEPVGREFESLRAHHQAKANSPPTSAAACSRTSFRHGSPTPRPVGLEHNRLSIARGPRMAVAAGRASVRLRGFDPSMLAR